MNYQKNFGDYVLTGVKNAFNNKTSWWLSKKYMTRAMYCFSTSGTGLLATQELDYQTAAIDSYVNAFATLFEQEIRSDIPDGI